DGKDENGCNGGRDRPARNPSSPARRRRGADPPGGIEHHPIGPHRPRDVLDLLLAHVLKRESELVAHLVADHAADANPARSGERLEPCCDIDAVAEYVALIDDDVADIDADAEFDATAGQHIGVPLGHLALDFDGTAYRVDDAGKLGKQTVAGSL